MAALQSCVYSALLSSLVTGARKRRQTRFLPGRRVYCRCDQHRSLSTGERGSGKAFVVDVSDSTKLEGKLHDIPIQPPSLMPIQNALWKLRPILPNRPCSRSEERRV